MVSTVLVFSRHASLPGVLYWSVYVMLVAKNLIGGQSVKRIICSIFCILFLLAQVTSLGAASSESKDMRGLIIDGQNFWFIISEPKGRTVNIEDARTKALNAYFTINGYTYDNTPGLIYIRVMEKGGLTVEENLKTDMDDFARRKSVKFKKFDVPGIRYHYAAMEYLIDNKTCDYLCYVDPGKEYKSYLIFVLSVDTKNSGKYVDVFQQLIKSFMWGGDQANDSASGKTGASQSH